MSLTCLSCEHWSENCAKGHTDEPIFLKSCLYANYVPGVDEERLGQIQARIERLPVDEWKDALAEVPKVLRELVRGHLVTEYKRRKAN